MWTSTLFQDHGWVIHGTSTRTDGSCRYPNADESEDPWKPARETFISGLNLDPRGATYSGNEHGRRIQYVDDRDHGRIHGVDGLLTDLSHKALCVKTADCLPLFFVEPNERMVGLIHAGWKGLAADIVSEAVETITGYGLYTSDLLVAIGPSIGPCHYRVHAERREEMLASNPHIDPSHFIERDGALFADLRAMATQTLLDAGVQKDHIDANPPCTVCHIDQYFSYHLGKNLNEAMLSVMAKK